MASRYSMNEKDPEFSRALQKKTHLAQWVKTGASAVFIAFGLLVLILGSIFVAGQFFDTFRLYVTGLPTRSVVESCTVVPTFGHNGLSSVTYRVKTMNRPKELPIGWCNPKKSVGLPVTGIRRQVMCCGSCRRSIS
jgi:hypothetical protein